MPSSPCRDPTDLRSDPHADDSAKVSCPELLLRSPLPPPPRTHDDPLPGLRRGNGGRLQRVGLVSILSMAGAVIFGLILGFMAPTQLFCVPRWPLGLTVLRALRSVLRGFVTPLMVRCPDGCDRPRWADLRGLPAASFTGWIRGFYPGGRHADGRAGIPYAGFM